MSTIKTDQARAAGYRALTNSYQLPQEQGLLDSVLADMRRGRIDHVLVKVNGGVAVWRRSLRTATSCPSGNNKVLV